jgi:nitrite reductase/ring-hydroxylating ferredoxin subunit
MPHANLPLARLPLNTAVRIEQEGMGIVLIRTDGKVCAYEDVCPHAFWPLSEGVVRDGVLECPGHGWEFNVDSGRCLNAPAYCLTPVSATVLGETVMVQWNEKKQESVGQNPPPASHSLSPTA